MFFPLKCLTLKPYQKCVFIYTCCFFMSLLNLIQNNYFVTKHCFYMINVKRIYFNIIWGYSKQMVNDSNFVSSLFKHPATLTLIFCRNWKWLDFATSIGPGQPVYPCCLTRLYSVGWPTFTFSSWYPKKWKWTGPKMEGGLFH